MVGLPNYKLGTNKNEFLNLWKRLGKGKVSAQRAENHINFINLEMDGFIYGRNKYFKRTTTSEEKNIFDVVNHSQCVDPFPVFDGHIVP